MGATADPELLSGVCRVLGVAGRPLSTRRIQRLFPEPAPDLDLLKAVLAEASTNGGAVQEVRRGVFTLAGAEAAPKVSEPEKVGDQDEEEGEESPRRRRRAGDAGF